MKIFIKKACFALVAAILATTTFLSASNTDSSEPPRNESRLLSAEEKLALKSQRLEDERKALVAGVADENPDLLDGETEIPAVKVVDIVVNDEDAAEDREGGSAIAKSFSSKRTTKYQTTHDGALHPLTPKAVTQAAPISPFGEFVTLNDGITYKVTSSDRNRVLNWNLYDMILILPSSWFSNYDYSLVNIATGAHVDVEIVQPGPETLFQGYYILDIDYDNRRICLNDGSIWSMCRFDTSALKRWNPGDWITIGVNDDWLQRWNQNILININNTEFIRGNCLSEYGD
jgi:hypothetical protein